MLVLLDGMEGREGYRRVVRGIAGIYVGEGEKRAMDDEGEARRACECYRDSRIVGVRILSSYTARGRRVLWRKCQEEEGREEQSVCRQCMKYMIADR